MSGMTKISDRALAACPAIPGHAVAVCICEKIQAALDAERADAAVCVRAEIAREMRLRRVGMDEAGIMVCVRAENAARALGWREP